MAAIRWILSALAVFAFLLVVVKSPLVPLDGLELVALGLLALTLLYTTPW